MVALGEVPKKNARDGKFIFHIGSIFFGLNFVKRHDGRSPNVYAGFKFSQAQPMDAPKENARSSRELNRRENEGILQGGIASIGLGLCVRAGFRSTKADIITNVQLKNCC